MLKTVQATLALLRGGDMETEHRDRLLVVVDGEWPARRIVDTAVWLAREEGVRVELLRIDEAAEAPRVIAGVRRAAVVLWILGPSRPWRMLEALSDVLRHRRRTYPDSFEEVFDIVLFAAHPAPDFAIGELAWFLSRDPRRRPAGFVRVPDLESPLAVADVIGRLGRIAAAPRTERGSLFARLRSELEYMPGDLPAPAPASPPAPASAPVPAQRQARRRAGAALAEAAAAVGAGAGTAVGAAAAGVAGLASAVGAGAATAVGAAAAGVAGLASAFRAAAERARARTPDEALVRFSAAYPELVWPRRDYSLEVFAHTIDLDDEVLRMLNEDMRHQVDAHPRIERTAATSVLVGQIVRVEPDCPGLVFSPSSQQFPWNGHLIRVLFGMRVAPGEAGPILEGAVKIYVASLPAREIPLRVTVRHRPAEADRERPPLVEAPGHQVRFFSYCRVDRPIVRACASIYESMGDDIRADFRFRAGGSWMEQIQRNIEEADVFALFWSTDAAASHEVALEWRRALQLLRDKSTRFIRPLYWEPTCPNVPPELGHIHFAELDVTTIKGLSRRMAWKRRTSRLRRLVRRCGGLLGRREGAPARS
jgi:hypothetical protein